MSTQPIVTYSGDAGAASANYFVYVESAVWRYRRLSNERAEAAMRAALACDEHTATVMAESADKFAALANAVEAIETARAALENFA